MNKIPTLEDFDNSIDLSLMKIGANSEDFHERELWCDKMYVELHHNENEWGMTSHCFKPDGNYLKILDGRVYEGRWYQPIKEYNRIVIHYAKEKAEIKEAYDMGFIGQNYCVVLKKHGRAILRKESKYLALLNENFFDEVHTDWKDYINCLYKDGRSDQLWKWMFIAIGVLALIVLGYLYYVEIIKIINERSKHGELSLLHFSTFCITDWFSYLCNQKAF